MTGTNDLMAGMKELDDAYPGYCDAEEYYTGARAEYFADHRYRRALERTGTSYKVNFAKTPVNAVLDRMEISAITAADVATTKILSDVFRDNRMDLEIPALHRAACKFGDAYLLIWTTEEIEDDALDDPDSAEDEFDPDDVEDDDSVVGEIEMYYNDPRTMRIVYDPENPRRKAFAIKRWSPTGDTRTRVNLYYKNRIEKWITLQGTKGDKTEHWVEYEPDVPNPFGRIPVFHFRTERPYGLPVHFDAYGPQDIITKIVVTHMTTMDYHGYPQRWALSGGDLGDGGDDLEDFGLGDDVQNDALEDNPFGGRDRANLKGQPGSLWMFKNISKIGQFEAAQSDVFLKPFETYVRSMAQVTQTPLHYFDTPGDSPSGESLRVAEAPLVKRCDMLKLLFGSEWQDAGDFILQILKYLDLIKIPKTTGITHCTWKSSAAADDQLGWQLAIMKDELGLPIWQIFMEQGYTEDQLTKWEVPKPVYIPPAPAVPPGSNITTDPKTGMPIVQQSKAATRGNQAVPPPPVKTLPPARVNLTAPTGKIQ